MSGKSINRIALTVRDLSGMASFYETALGLAPMGGDQDIRLLGAGEQVLLELRADPAATPRDPHQAGLFHTAFLLPERSDLGRWLHHATRKGINLTGASDHGVSEAIYLNDPEGNGIEIYWDRPKNLWKRDRDRVEMLTMRLDLNNLIASASGGWSGIPDNGRIGHVHLQVGDLSPADRFFRESLELTRTFDGPGAAWYGWNGYHHHLAGNIWNSQGSPNRDPRMTGLAEIVLNDPEKSGETITDPWGTMFRMV